MSLETMDKTNESHTTPVFTNPVPPQPRTVVKKKNGKGCFFLGGCIIIILLLLAGMIGGILLFTPGRNFLKDRGIIKEANDTKTVESNDFDTKKLTYTKSDTPVSEDKIVGIVNNASTATVAIALTTDQSTGRFGNGSKIKTTDTIGTGFIVDKTNGYVVTNQHVACVGTTTTFKVITSDDKVFNVKEIYEDPNDDLAVLLLDVKDNPLPSQLTLSSADVKVGQTVIAIGNPSGFIGSVSTGIVSGKSRNIQSSGTCRNGAQNSKDYYEVYQTDAAINPGNSGGPLLNTEGEVIGVNSATGVGVQNISFSVPSDRVIKKLEELKKFGKFKNPFIGVSHTIVDDISSQVYKTPQGAYIESVSAGSPAEKAGIKEGDTITEISGKKINFSLVGVVSSFSVGETVKVKVIRKDDAGNQKELTVDVVLADRSDFPR